jgi:HAD superfamily hydrolase (TIGR01459 family)
MTKASAATALPPDPSRPRNQDEGFGAYPTLRELAPRYDLLFCDIWGVVHDGLVAFPAAGDALVRYRDQGGTIVLISNAPRPGDSVARQLDRLGVPRRAWDAILTSGDLTRNAIIERRDQVVHHIGPPRDNVLFEDLDLRFGDIQAADYVVCSGLLDDDRETVDDYRERLQRMRARDLWMICANPDIVVGRGDRLVPCAGAIALAYEEMGGSVYYAGKPHAPVYETAMQKAAKIRGEAVPRDRVLAIGDAMRTDIAGAAGFGIDALLIAHGIHGDEIGLKDGVIDAARLSAWLACQECQPQAVAPALIWD